MSEATLMPPAAKGPLTRLVTQLFFRAARVSANLELAPALHHITLQGEALKGVAWTAGDKIQIRLGAGLQTRTYTPIAWDPVVGSTSFVAQTLSPGPGSEWVTHAKSGDMVELMGPRSSLALGTSAKQDVWVLGDETAFGLTLAMGVGRAVLEVDSPEHWGPLCHAWGLPATLVAKQPDDAHLARWEESIGTPISPQTHFILAGRANTIQYLLKALRARGIRSDRIRSKAYWAPGKTGLD